MPSGSHYRSYPRQRPTRTPSFPTPLFAHDPFASFFTDPFTLFNSIFDDMHHHSSGPRVHTHSQVHSPFRASPFSNIDRMQAEIEDFMENIDRDPFGVGLTPRFTPRSRISTFPTIDNEDGGGRWVSNSFMSTTINGVTQSIQKQKDSNVSIQPTSMLLIAYRLWSGQRTYYSHVSRWPSSSHRKWCRAASSRPRWIHGQFQEHGIPIIRK